MRGRRLRELDPRGNPNSVARNEAIRSLDNHYAHAAGYVYECTAALHRVEAHHYGVEAPRPHPATENPLQ